MDRKKMIDVTRTSSDTSHIAAHKRKFPLNPPPPPTSFTKGPSGSRTRMTTAGVVPPEAPRNPVYCEHKGM